MASRGEKIKTLSGLLFAHCVQDHRAQVEARGSLSPTNSLRHKVTRDRLGFARELTGDNGCRYFTESLVRDALLEMVRVYQAKLPNTPPRTSIRS